jgi:orotate phosphoribosyltransferase
LQILQDHGALYLPEGGYHFQGVSGKHMNGYCNTDPVFPYVGTMSRMLRSIVEQFRDDGVETVLGAGVGGIALQNVAALHLEEMTGREMRGIWADKYEPRQYRVERGGFAQHLPGKRILIVEDMINQMYTVKKLVDVANECGADLVGVGSIATNRGVSAEAIGVPKLFSLCEFGYDVWVQDDCALCAEHAPMVVDLGHGDKFVEAHPGYPSRTILEF